MVLVDVVNKARLKLYDSEELIDWLAKIGWF